MIYFRGRRLVCPHQQVRFESWFMTGPGSVWATSSLTFRMDQLNGVQLTRIFGM